MTENTNNLYLRLATANDAGLLTHWWNDGSVMEHAGFPLGLQQSLDQTLAQIASIDAKHNPRFIIEMNGTPIGESNYTLKDGIAYPGWKICDSTYQNKGYGTTLILRIFAHLFQAKQVHTIVWDTTLENRRAQFVYETKIKARKTKVQEQAWKDQLGNWRTAVYYEITKEEFRDLHPDFMNKHQPILFDEWSLNYDSSVREADESNRYPFAGYQAIQKILIETASKYEQPIILDIGIGTGTLVKQLPQDATIIGIDFSLEMLRQAQEQHPQLTTIHHDFSIGLPDEIKNMRFDIIFCNYAIHHLMPKQQQSLIQEALSLLNPSGILLIADVMTATQEEMNRIKHQDQDLWDDEEHYLIVDHLVAWFPNQLIQWQKMSYCAGIVSMPKT